MVIHVFFRDDYKAAVNLTEQMVNRKSLDILQLRIKIGQLAAKIRCGEGSWKIRSAWKVDV